jgi:integrase
LGQSTAKKDQFCCGAEFLGLSLPTPSVRFNARVGITDWTLHDFRRCIATHMSEKLAVQPHIVELVLGHEFRAGLQARYNRALYEGPIRDAYLRWHDYLRTLIDGGERKVRGHPARAGRNVDFFA